MKMEITLGWDGEVITEKDFDTGAEAHTFLQNFAHSKGYTIDVWTYTSKPNDVTIIDFGSHSYFGRLTNIKKENK